MHAARCSTPRSRPPTGVLTRGAGRGRGVPLALRSLASATPKQAHESYRCGGSQQAQGVVFQVVGWTMLRPLVDRN